MINANLNSNFNFNLMIKIAILKETIYLNNSHHQIKRETSKTLVRI